MWWCHGRWSMAYTLLLNGFMHMTAAVTGITPQFWLWSCFSFLQGLCFLLFRLADQVLLCCWILSLCNLIIGAALSLSFSGLLTWQLLRNSHYLEEDMFLSESFCCFCCDNSGYRFLYNGLLQIMNSLSCTYRHPPLGFSLGLCFFSCLLIGCCYFGSSEISISLLSASSQFFRVDFRW
jgi:hypothetical protein